MSPCWCPKLGNVFNNIDENYKRIQLTWIYNWNRNIRLLKEYNNKKKRKFQNKNKTKAELESRRIFDAHPLLHFKTEAFRNGSEEEAIFLEIIFVLCCFINCSFKIHYIRLIPLASPSLLLFVRTQTIHVKNKEKNLGALLIKALNWKYEPKSM